MGAVGRGWAADSGEGCPHATGKGCLPFSVSAALPAVAAACKPGPLGVPSGLVLGSPLGGHAQTFPRKEGELGGVRWSLLTREAWPSCALRSPPSCGATVSFSTLASPWISSSRGNAGTALSGLLEAGLVTKYPTLAALPSFSSISKCPRLAWWLQQL